MAGWRGPRELDLAWLRRTVPIVDVLEQGGFLVGLRCVRGELVGACPLPAHGGDRSNRTAFRVSPSRGCWRCFTHCGGGDVVDLALRLGGGDYCAAARLLASTLTHVGGPRALTEPPDTARREREPLSAFTPYTRQLALHPVHPFLRAKRITPTVARLFGCGFWPRGGFLRSSIGVRLHDLAGRPLGYAARRLRPEDIAARGKWSLPRGLPKRTLLYNWHRVDPRAHTIILVEGPFDAMRVHQAGFPAVLALLGTHASPAQLDHLRALRRLVLLLDGDPAGAHATTSLLAALHPGDVRAIRLPSPHGPADLADHELAATLAPPLP